MVCRLFGTKPLSEQTFRYSQQLLPGPLVYRNKLQWNFNQIENFSFTEMHLNRSSVKWQPFCQGGGGGGGGGGAFSILMFGLIFTSFIGTFYRWSQWHWIKYLNIIDVMVWFSLAAITYVVTRPQWIQVLLGVIGFMKWWQRRGRLGELVTLRKYIWKIYQLSEVGLKWLIYFAADLAGSSKNLYV